MDTSKPLGNRGLKVPSALKEIYDRRGSFVILIVR